MSNNQEVRCSSEFFSDCVVDDYGGGSRFSRNGYKRTYKKKQFKETSSLNTQF